ncbi:FmdB family zinc ribbon protein [Sagittula sp. SSi028]|uniref:FmdB family zinc ribbon protein n=1 Tax=Sagittula sp. SSi028 TaxID=3400636 RepID=UPI003AF9C1E0
MPYYDYLCDACGPFTESAPMADFDKPCDCPACGTAAPRVLLQAPRFANMDAGRRTAFATNERSQHAPKSSRAHPPGCGCCSGTSKTASRTLHRPDGSKSFPSARPWMISH